jgi:DNA polymerase I-like protein with 3'-5' exonuclease and polymerase domains
LNIITTKEQLKEMVDYYLTQDSFAFDVETVGDHRGTPAVNEVLWISFATHGRGDVIPMGHPHGEFMSESFPLTGQGEKRVAAGLPSRELDFSRDKKKAIKVFDSAPVQMFPAEVFKALKPLLFNDSKLTIGHNLVFDLSSVAKYYNGSIPTGPYFDTLMASFLYDNKNKGRLGLDDCLQRELGYSMEKGIGHQVELYSFNDVAKYSYLDAKYTFLLWKTLVPKLTAADVDNVMKLEMDVLRVLCDMKLTGAPIDMKQLQILYDKLIIEIEEVKSNIYRIAGQPFNINSNNEKQYILYGPRSEGCRGLRPQLLTGKGSKKEESELDYKDYSVSAEALEPYREKDELVNALRTYADLNKLLSTYVIPYLGGEVTKTVGGKSKVEVRDSMLVNGRIYGDFVQWGAETGRFSSRNPNLQNVPAPHTVHGRSIRNLFTATEGYKLVVADYSQIEPRIIASLSQDPVALEYYRKGKDMYTAIGDVMGVERKVGKMLVLAISYGVGPEKIARSIDCSEKEARNLIDQFSEEFHDIIKYKAKVIRTARGRSDIPFVETLLGRRRYLPDLKSTENGLKFRAERQAFNTMIQGSAADLMKLALVRAHSCFTTEPDVNVVLTVHDELVTVAREDLAEECAEAIRDSMEGVKLPEIIVPLIADIHIVDKWGEAK